jgi:hypothetical protein
MTKPPAVDEREFLKITRNHGEFTRTLQVLGFAVASTEVAQNAHHVGVTWLHLAIEHIADARAGLHPVPKTLS